MVSIYDGVNEKTAPGISREGADILVAGTAVFRKADRKAAINKLTV